MSAQFGVDCCMSFMQELNNRWRSLQQLAEERSNMLGSAHEVQRFHRYQPNHAEEEMWMCDI